MKKKGSLSRLLVLFFLIVGLIPMLTIGIISFVSSNETIVSSHNALEERVSAQLISLRKTKSAWLENLATIHSGMMDVLGKSEESYSSFEILHSYHNEIFSEYNENTGRTEVNQELARVSGIDVTTEEYQKKWSEVDKIFSKYVTIYGFYDVIMCCAAHGHVLYTHTKESDLGENLVTGRLKDSPLAKAWEKGKKEVSFQDFMWYEPSDEPAAFWSAPVYHDNKVIAVVILQIPRDMINNIMQFRTGMGETAETVIVGSDYKLRSDSRVDKQFTVMNSFKSDDIRLDSIAVKKGLAGEEGSMVLKDYRGEEVLEAYQPFPLPGGVMWVTLSKIDAKEAFADVEKIKQSANTTFLIDIIIAVILIVLVIIFALLLSRSITRPLKEAVKFAEAISNKDLTKTIEIKRNDELGELADSLESMRSQLIKIIQGITESSTHLAASSEEINASAQSLSDGAQTQSASVEETSSSMEELSAAIEEVSSSGTEISQKSIALKEIAEGSQTIIGETIQAMSKIKESSNRIEEIIGVINDIADQTNLLSLNASIEAARAGEYGRGFAVVAQEISKLADRSANSTKEVRQLMQESISNVENGVELVNESGEAFKTINNDVESNVDQINSIVDAIEQQSQGAQQVQASMNTINDITQSVSSSAEELSSSTVELQKQAEQLAAIISEFKMERDMVFKNQSSSPEKTSTEVNVVEDED